MHAFKNAQRSYEYDTTNPRSYLCYTSVLLIEKVEKAAIT